MAQTTQYKRSFAGSVGAGLGSLMNGKGKTYFILEHKVSSSYHKAGEAQEIIVDQIELGRDSRCQVRFDESFSTVSRRHAAIIRDGDNWKLVQLSQTNQTFLNGHPVQKEWYLQNGDEIQLAVNGPKLGFIIPTGNKSTVGSIGLSRRLSLFRQQALMPYKKAMWAMAAVLVLVIAGGTWFGLHQKGIIDEQAGMITILDSVNLAHEQAITDMLAKNEELIGNNQQMQKRLNTMQKKLNNVSKNISVSSKVTGKSIDKCAPAVYFIYVNEVYVQLPDGDSKTIDYDYVGTGFLLNDGRFVTARHIIEPWSYIDSDNDTTEVILNLIENNGGIVRSHLHVYSPDGTEMDFWSNQFVVNKASDKIKTNEGTKMRLGSWKNDWAYVRTDKSGGLPFDNAMSQNLKVQTKLTVLGYPLALGANSRNNIEPIYGSAVVAKNGLDEGMILVTEATIEHGSSGCPIFCSTQDGGLAVVGIASAIGGRSTGFIVPISALR